MLRGLNPSEKESSKKGEGQSSRMGGRGVVFERCLVTRKSFYKNSLGERMSSIPGGICIATAFGDSFNESRTCTFGSHILEAGGKDWRHAEGKNHVRFLPTSCTFIYKFRHSSSSKSKTQSAPVPPDPVRGRRALVLRLAVGLVMLFAVGLVALGQAVLSLEADRLVNAQVPGARVDGSADGESDDGACEFWFPPVSTVSSQNWVGRGGEVIAAGLPRGSSSGGMRLMRRRRCEKVCAVRRWGEVPCQSWCPRSSNSKRRAVPRCSRRGGCRRPMASRTSLLLLLWRHCQF